MHGWCRFSGKDEIGTTSILKSSAQRGIRKQLLDQYPSLTEEILEAILPKKSSIMQSKCRENNVVLFVVEGEPLFLQHFDGPIIPTLRTLHKCTFPLAMVAALSTYARARSVNSSRHVAQGAS